MGFAEVILTAMFMGISAHPIEQYVGVPQTNPLPLYWTGSPQPGQFQGTYDATLTPDLYNYYRGTPAASPALVNPPLPSPPQPNPTATITLTPISAPNTWDPSNARFPLLSQTPPSAAELLYQKVASGLPILGSDIPVPNSVTKTSGTPLAVTPKNPKPLEGKVPLAKDDVLPNTENTKESSMPRVTIFAPGSIIGPDLIQTAFGKAFEEGSGTSVFIYAPGSLFITEGEASSSAPRIKADAGAIIPTSSKPSQISKPNSLQDLNLPMDVLSKLSNILNPTAMSVMSHPLEIVDPKPNIGSPFGISTVPLNSKLANPGTTSIGVMSEGVVPLASITATPQSGTTKATAPLP